MLKMVPQDRAPYADSKMVLKISVAQKTKKLEPFAILGRNPELYARNWLEKRCSRVAVRT